MTTLRLPLVFGIASAAPILKEAAAPAAGKADVIWPKAPEPARHTLHDVLKQLSGRVAS